MTSGFHSILAAVDMSPASGQVIDRAATLARKHGAALKVMDVSPLIGTPASPANMDLSELVRLAADRLGSGGEVLSERATSVSAMAESNQGGLVVLNHDQRLRPRSLWKGSLANQLMRVGKNPLLILKTPPNARENYEHLLVAVDLTPSANHLVALACHLEKSSKVEILHAIRPLHSNPLRDAEMPNRILRDYLLRRKLEANSYLLCIANRAGKGRDRVTTVLRDGEPAWHTALQQVHRKADLVVVGKRRTSALADMLFGGVTKRILAWCEVDILVVPCDDSHANQSINCSSAVLPA